ncbi:MULTISPECIES: hypothetical protein [unclassified Streptomyces]|uniref:hypothetical protein n=1 Tax=unclassified Streptomyces TaxID=2593676 RepID=UPI0019D2F286|nr:MULTISPECIES: hypothetical protein [unclassified Streptomyces]
MPGQFSDPRGHPLTLFAVLAVASGVWLVTGLRARARRTRSLTPMDRVRHPQETVPLTPAEELAFGRVVSRLSLASSGRLR